MAACSAQASGYIGVVTFDEKPAAALVPGDQVVQRDGGSQLARADLRTIARVDREGDLVYVTFAKGSSRTAYHASALIVVLPKVQRSGWWEDR
jgi:hypothetical protein